MDQEVIMQDDNVLSSVCLKVHQVTFTFSQDTANFCAVMDTVVDQDG